VLYGLLRGAEGEGYAVLARRASGGVLFAALMLAGAAVEIVYPATLARFRNVQQDAQLGVLSLALSGRMYRFAFVGMSTLIAAASLVALGTGVLPRGLAWAGSLFALAALLRLVGPLGAWLTLLWIIAVSLLRLAGHIGSTDGPRTRTARSSWTYERLVSLHRVAGKTTPLCSSGHKEKPEPERTPAASS
jgi:hypothetical protein